MKMKLLKLGAERLDKNTAGFYVKLAMTEADAEHLRAFEGMEVEVEIRPHLLFQIGDAVHYSSVIGEAPTLRDSVIEDGPFVIGSTLCWTIRGVRGGVAQAALVAAA